MLDAFTICLLEANLIFFFWKWHFSNQGGHCNYLVGVFLLVLLIYFITRQLTCTQGDSFVMTGNKTRLLCWSQHHKARSQFQRCNRKASPATTQTRNSGFAEFYLGFSFEDSLKVRSFIHLVFPSHGLAHQLSVSASEGNTFGFQQPARFKGDGINPLFNSDFPKTDHQGHVIYYEGQIS